MGGRALLAKGVVCHRINSREEFDAYAREIQQALSAHYGFVEVCLEPMWKQSFGDMDILVSEPLGEVVYPTPNDTVAVVVNGNVTSFAWKTNDGFIQVDLILVPRETVEFARLMLFSDVGVCIGQLFHKMQCKLSHKGLLMQHKDVNVPLLLTTQLHDILQLLQYKEDFPFHATSKEEVYEWLLSTPFDIYGCCVACRHASKKRPFFTEFLSFCKARKESSLLPSPMPLPTHEQLLQHFGKLAEWKRIQEEHECEMQRQRMFQERLNAKVLKEMVGCEGREIGEWMRRLCEEKGRDEIVSMSHEQVREWILSHVESRKE